MSEAWQVPISCQDRGRKILAHWFEVLQSTDSTVQTACGLKVNPGFAKLARASVRRCLNCIQKGAGK